MLVYRWSTVYDAGPTLNQHLFNVLCLLGYIRMKGVLLGTLIRDTEDLGALEVFHYIFFSFHTTGYVSNFTLYSSGWICLGCVGKPVSLIDRERRQTAHSAG